MYTYFQLMVKQFRWISTVDHEDTNQRRTKGCRVKSKNLILVFALHEKNSNRQKKSNRVIKESILSGATISIISISITIIYIPISISGATISVRTRMMFGFTKG